MSDVPPEVAVLQEARERIANSDHWTRYTAARSMAGRSVRPTSPVAVAWCATGAVHATKAVWIIRQLAIAQLDQAAYLCDGVGAEVFNDAKVHTHADVLRLFDLAIERAAWTGSQTAMTDL